MCRFFLFSFSFGSVISFSAGNLVFLIAALQLSLGRSEFLTMCQLVFVAIGYCRIVNCISQEFFVRVPHKNVLHSIQPIHCVGLHCAIFTFLINNCVGDLKINWFVQDTNNTSTPSQGYYLYILLMAYCCVDFVITYFFICGFCAAGQYCFLSD